MVTERIERESGVRWWQIVWGYGRIQRIRAAYRNLLPESAKQALVLDPDANLDVLLKDVPFTVRAEYSANVSREILRAVLKSAHDWDGVGVDEYVDDHLPEDVALEIVDRVRGLLSAVSGLDDDGKKN